MSERSHGRRANGSGSITFRADGALVVRATDPNTGQRVKRIVRRGERADGRPETPAQHRQRAERALASLREEVNRPAALRERWTVERWAREKYLPSLTVSPGTEASYTYDLEQYVLPYLGRIELARLTAEHVDDLDRTLSAKGLSLGTRRHARGALSRVLRHARRKGRLQRLVTDDADGLATDIQDRTKNALEPQQVRALLTAARSSEWELPIALLGLLGLRRSEVLGLAWDAVDLERGTVSVRRSMVMVGSLPLLGRPKTHGSVRTLDISPPIISLIRSQRRRQSEWRMAAGEAWQGPVAGPDGERVDLVLTDEVGRSMSPWRLAGALKRFAAATGIPHVHPHQLRHSTASMLIAEGVDVAAVGAVLGHANPSITLGVYSHAFARTKSAATAAVADAVGTW